jgi:peroxidase
MEEIIMGLLNQKSMKSDDFVTDQVTDHLFPEPHSAPFGTDLIARNIQRSRDHNLPGFCCYYQKFHDPTYDCNKPWTNQFNDRFADMSTTQWGQLKKLYQHPSHIDLFTGGLAQATYNNGLVGRVFNKIISK